ncbi:hypothetical protein Tco_0679926 [Tanacetum coccineum]|uniref:Uncharacterized protein n=1 Tax=Tanacetum coccineum TaxID=301880 RepID=A0ABQ4XJW1_9ASTR
MLHLAFSPWWGVTDITTNTKPFPTFVHAQNMLLLHESHDEYFEPHDEPMLDATTALYCIAHQNNNGKGKNKYNKNKGINHGDPKVPTSPHPGYGPIPQFGGYATTPTPQLSYALNGPSMAPPAPHFTDLASVFSSMSLQ